MPPPTCLSPHYMLSNMGLMMTTVEQTLPRMSKEMVTQPQEATGLLFLMAEPRLSAITLMETQEISKMSPMKVFQAMDQLL